MCVFGSEADEIRGLPTMAHGAAIARFALPLSFTKSPPSTSSVRRGLTSRRFHGRLLVSLTPFLITARRRLSPISPSCSSLPVLGCVRGDCPLGILYGNELSGWRVCLLGRCRKEDLGYIVYLAGFAFLDRSLPPAGYSLSFSIIYTTPLSSLAFPISLLHGSSSLFIYCAPRTTDTYSLAPPNAFIFLPSNRSAHTDGYLLAQ